MPFEMKDFSGQVFVNDRKQSDNQPDRKGKAMIDGKMYWVSGWIKQGNNGPWLSLAFTLMEEQGNNAPPQQQAPQRQQQRQAPPPARRDQQFNQVGTTDDNCPF